MVDHNLPYMPIQTLFIFIYQQPESFLFLDQSEYVKQVGVTSMTDFRYIYQADFLRAHLNDDGSTFSFVLKAVKPSRVVTPSRYA